ncbi:hypothetical protein ACTXT7_014118 [Hymenolepis weldensis]
MEKNVGILPQEENDAVPIPESHSLPLNEPNIPSSDICKILIILMLLAIKEMLGYGINASSIFTEIVFAHPFLVLRHQCQVRGRSKILHLTPLSLLPALHTYISRQGVISLWKGLSGAITVKIIRIVSENTLSEALSLPKDITSYSSPSKIFLHILLKILSWMIATPFYAASMVEFVQRELYLCRPGAQAIMHPHINLTEITPECIAHHPNMHRLCDLMLMAPYQQSSFI